MKARATDNDLIWENFNQSTPVTPEELTPAQSAEPVPELPEENYGDFFHTDGSLSPEVEEIVLTVRDHVINMSPREEDFEENLGLYLNQLGKAVVKNIDL